MRELPRARLSLTFAPFAPFAPGAVTAVQADRTAKNRCRAEEEDERPVD